jgi:nucleotide-binding universal stress UspA family protein
MPFHPKKILVATDFSEHARSAADAAGVMARAFDAKVTLVHVIPLGLYVDVATHMEGRTFTKEDFQASVIRRTKKDAEIELERLKGDGVFAEYMTVDGPPPSEIARVAKEGNYDLVVMSTHGRTGLMHLAMGSVAENVVRLCTVPVLVVRPAGAETTPAPSKA